MDAAKQYANSMAKFHKSCRTPFCRFRDSRGEPEDPPINTSRYPPLSRPNRVPSLVPEERSVYIADPPVLAGDQAQSPSQVAHGHSCRLFGVSVCMGLGFAVGVKFFLGGGGGGLGG